MFKPLYHSMMTNNTYLYFLQNGSICLECFFNKPTSIITLHLQFGQAAFQAARGLVAELYFTVALRDQHAHLFPTLGLDIGNLLEVMCWGCMDRHRTLLTDGNLKFSTELP